MYTVCIYISCTYMWFAYNAFHRDRHYNVDVDIFAQSNFVLYAIAFEQLNSIEYVQWIWTQHRTLIRCDDVSIVHQFKFRIQSMFAVEVCKCVGARCNVAINYVNWRCRLGIHKINKQMNENAYTSLVIDKLIDERNKKKNI